MEHKKPFTPYPQNAGTNVMKMSEFEEYLARREKKDRAMATKTYVEGIQGTDGGECPSEKY